MRASDDLYDDPVRGTLVKDSKGVWRPLAETDMSHKTDAVSWWNSTGRYFGAKAPEVRNWMLKSDNYVLDYFRYKSAGGKLTETYLPPVK